MPGTKAPGCHAGATRTGPVAGELSEPVSSRRSTRDHSDPSRRRGLLVLGISGGVLNHDGVYRHGQGHGGV